MNKFLLYLCILSLGICTSHTDAQVDWSVLDSAAFRDSLNASYFWRHPRDGVEIVFSSCFDVYRIVIFHKPADFERALLTMTVDFSNARFASKASFMNAEFTSTADFNGAQFDSAVSFDYTRFEKMASFKNARFLNEVSFYRATMPPKLDFRFVTNINKEIDFSFARLDVAVSKCQIALVGSDISKIKLDMRLLELWFPADTTWVKDLWNKNTDTVKNIDSITYDQRIGVYEQVLKKLKDDGLMESYQTLDIEYKQLKYSQKGAWGAFVNLLDSNWWNYGYNPERIFAYSAGFWCLFSLVNMATYRKLSNGVYAISFLDAIHTRVGNPVKRAFFYVLKVFAYTSVVFFGLKMDLEKFRDGALKRHPFLFGGLIFEYVVGLVCLGFIVNIIFTR